MKIYRPLWNEGALLSPQQFQQQSDWETFRSTGVAALASPFAWGVERVELDEKAKQEILSQVQSIDDNNLKSFLNSIPNQFPI